MTLWLKGLICTLGIVGAGGVATGGYFLKSFEKSVIESAAEESKSHPGDRRKEESIDLKGSSNSLEQTPFGEKSSVRTFPEVTYGAENGQHEGKESHTELRSK